jgi:hypothetical protein
VQTVLAEAAARAPGAVKGTPLQQVGDLYASGMDVGRLTLLKAEPIKSEWARIEAIDSKQVLAESIAHFSLVLSDGTMFGSGILPEPRDNTQYNHHLSRRNAADGCAGKLPFARHGQGPRGVPHDGGEVSPDRRCSPGRGPGSGGQDPGDRVARGRQATHAGAGSAIPRCASSR